MLTMPKLDPVKLAREAPQTFAYCWAFVQAYERYRKTKESEEKREDRS